MGKTWIICLDLDDTLIPNTHKYHAPIWRCGQIITDALGEKSVYPNELLKLRSEIDMKLVQEKGFAAARFPESWIKVYEAVCERLGRQPDAQVSLRLYEAANQFQRGPFELFFGVKETLVGLRQAGHSLHIVTAGDEDLQQRKIAESGVNQLVDSANVTSMKKIDVLRRLIDGRPEDAMMVGDSKRSDIQPAIELGMIAIWIPVSTWGFAEADVDGYRQIGSINELPDLIRILD